MNPLAAIIVSPCFGRCLTARATHASHRAALRRLGLSVGIAIAVSACSPTPFVDACVRKDSGEVLRARDWSSNGIVDYWEVIDANGIKHTIGEHNSHEFACEQNRGTAR